MDKVRYSVISIGNMGRDTYEIFKQHKEQVRRCYDNRQSQLDGQRAVGEEIPRFLIIRIFKEQHPRRRHRRTRTISTGHGDERFRRRASCPYRKAAGVYTKQSRNEQATKISLVRYDSTSAPTRYIKLREMVRTAR